MSANAADSPINVTGLTNGTPYTCKVRTTTTTVIAKRLVDMTPMLGALTTTSRDFH